jgi:hypothetical protein
MKQGTLALFCATVLAGLPSLSHAQTTDPIGADAGAPISDGTTGAPIKTEVEAGTGSKQATVKVNLLWLGKPPEDRNGVAVLNSRSLNLTVSTPWDGEGDASPASLDGFAGGTSAKLEYVLIKSPRATMPSANALAITDKAIGICKGKANTEFERLKEELRDPASPAYAAALANLNKQHQEQLKACDEADPDDVIASHLPGRLREYTAELFPSDTGAFGLHATIGYDKFSYVDPATLAKGEDKKTGWGVGASFTNYFRKTPTALTITLDYEVAFEEQDEQIFCPFNAGPGSVACVEDHAGPPKLDRSVKFGVNVRHRFADSKGKSRIAVGPSVTYDVTDDVWGLELPIYFIPGKDETLTGGFKVGYRSDRKDVTFGLFIGAAFGLWD